MNYLVLVFSMATTGPNIPESHIQRIAYPTYHACKIQESRAAHMKSMIEYAYCRPDYSEKIPAIVVSQEFVEAARPWNYRGSYAESQD